MSDTARIGGLRDFNRAIKQASTDTARDLKRELIGEVAEPVAERIRGNVPTRTGRWRRSIRAGATQKGAHITWGRKTVPYAGWMEFGGGIPNKRNRTGAPRIRRPREADGRYVFPEVGQARAEAEQTAQQVLHRAFQRAQLEIRESR